MRGRNLPAGQSHANITSRHDLKLDMYRLYTEVQVSTLFTQPRAEGRRLCKSHRDRTEVYNGLVPWAMAPSESSVKKLASIKAYHRPMAGKLSCFELSQRWLAH